MGYLIGTLKQLKQVGITLLLLGMGFPALGQRDNTIYQNLATNSTTALPRFLGPVTNIGQGFHQVIVSISAIPTKTCAVTTMVGTSPVIGFVGAYINSSSTAVNLSQVNFVLPKTSAGPFDITVQATGPYPYVWILLQGIDTGNCRYTVNYSGSLFPPAPIAPTAGFGFAIAQSSAAGAVTLVPAAPYNLGAGIYYGLLVNTTAGQTVTFTCGASVLLSFDNLQAGQVVQLPYQGLPHTVCATGNATQMVLTNATKVTFSYYIGLTIIPLSAP